MAESDEWATVETVEDDVYYESKQPSASLNGPNFKDYYNKLITFFIVNAWYIVFAGIVLYFLWQRFKGKIAASRNAGPSRSPEEIYARQEAMETIRRKMQEQYDLKAQAFAAKQKEKEELARQEKLKNLENYGSVLGRASKSGATDSKTNSDENFTSVKRKTEKAKFKPEYNPLMGNASGSGASFRPSRRSTAGG